MTKSELENHFRKTRKRLFTVLLFFFCIGFSGFLLPGAAPSKSEKPSIPADLLYQHKEVPAEENAVVWWRRASAVQIIPIDSVQDSIGYAWKPSAKLPTPEQRSEINEWLRQNKEALGLMEQSLGKPNAQWLMHHVQDLQPEVSALGFLMRARLVEADQWAEDHQFTKAADSLKASLHITQRAVEADAAFLHYLVAGNARVLVEHAILRLANRADIPVNILENLLKNLPSLDSETNVYSQILRVEFTMYSYPTLDVRLLANQWTKYIGTNDLLLFALYPEELHRPFQILLDPSMVAMHPKAIDAEFQIERAIRTSRIYRTNVSSPWSSHSDMVAKWSEQTQNKLLRDIKPLMITLEDEPLPLSKQAANRASATYLRIKNPVGRLFDCGTGNLTASDRKVFRFRAEREATRAILALKIFERKTNHLPGSLKELVDVGILKSVPKDLFSGESLLYSREKKAVWSVGEDGVNNGGKTSTKSRWSEEDVVWKIPENK